MQFKHHWYLLVATVALTFAGVLGVDTTAQAATWHAGTPTALRGVWRTKIQHSLRTYIHIGKTTYNDEQQYDTKHHYTTAGPYRVTNVHYHH